jgi:2-keto-4-pentenoate hydratase/2-oxohepta-3-ene-1,7-dioic acid hydratase in catechol pathway
MRLVTFRHGSSPAQFGIREDDRVTSIASATENAVLADLAGAARKPTGPSLPLSEITLLQPVMRPGKVICIGLNYVDHAKEGGNLIPDYPAVFLRATTSLVGPGQPILRPPVSEKLDYEAELAIIIGKPALRVREAEAPAHVAGYSCFNDGSLRDYQRKSTQWTMGKNFDATGAFGPEIVTPDELPEGAQGLRVATRLNGQTLQDGNTRDMIFSVARTIAILSEVMTLEPGDVIITGTPAGVGYPRKPPIFMKPGDTCEIEIEGIGVLSNPIADAVASA